MTLQRHVDIQIQMINFDWHQNIKTLGMSDTIHGMWTLTANAIRNIGLRERAKEKEKKRVGREGKEGGREKDGERGREGERGERERD